MAPLIAAIVYRLTARILPAAVSGAAFLGLLFVYQWSVFGRVDTLAVVFALSAVLVAVCHPTPAGVAGAALLCVLGLYTKQAAVAAPVAILLYYLWVDRRLAVYFARNCSARRGRVRAVG